MSNPRWGRLIAACVLTVLTCLVGAGPASAHDALIGSTPEDGAVVPTSPPSVVLEFFDPIGPISPAMVLRDDHDDVVQKLDPTITDRTLTGALPADLADGTYSVAWRVVSDDGHPVQGITRFAVGRPSTSMDYSGGESAAASSGGSAGPAIWIAIAVLAAAAAGTAVLVVRGRRADRTTT